MPDIEATNVLELLDELRTEYSQRNSEIAVARARYRGEHWDDSSNPAQPGKYSLVVNYIPPVTHGAVTDLLGRAPGIQAVAPDTTEASRRQAEAKEAFLYHVWAENRAPLVFRRVAFNAFLVKQGVFYYWWDNERKLPRFTSVVPEDFYPVMDGDDIAECVWVTRERTSLLKRRYPKLADRIVGTPDLNAIPRGASALGYEAQAYPDGMGGFSAGYLTDALSEQGIAQLANSHYTHTTVVDYFDRDGQWVRIMGGAVHRQRLGYGTGEVPFLPVVFNPGGNGEDRGPLDDVFELNQYLDQIMSQQADIIRKYADPTLVDYGSGQDPKEVKRIIREGGGIVPAKPTARLEFLNWTGTPPDLAGQYDRVLNAIYDLSGRPAASYGQTVTNQSGVMTNLSMTPTVAAASDRITLFGDTLIRLNAACLLLFEKFHKGEKVVTALRPTGRSHSRTTVVKATITPETVGGFYETRIKWPSVLKTDDPVFVQNELAKANADPPKQSIYTTLENLGVEDVEAEIDRIREQLEDPRLHPERLESAISAAQAFTGSPVEGDMAGFDGLGPDPMLAPSLMAAGNPNASPLSSPNPVA